MARQPIIGLVAGLGNPGSEYTRTRHNAGFWFVDALAEFSGATFRQETRFRADVARATIAGHTVWLLKPTTFMNESGLSVAACASYYKIKPAETLVAHDELSLAAGRLAYKRGGGHGGHNGLRDISRHFGGEYLRARIGIGRPRAGNDVAAYVLSSPPAAERDAIHAAIGAAVDTIATVIEGDIERATAAIAKLTK